MHQGSVVNERVADRKYAETVAQQFGLGSLLKLAEVPNTQGVPVSEKPLCASSATVYRMIAAYANCLFRDREDMEFVAEELGRHMLRSRQCD